MHVSERHLFYLEIEFVNRGASYLFDIIVMFFFVKLTMRLIYFLITFVFSNQYYDCGTVNTAVRGRKRDPNSLSNVHGFVGRYCNSLILKFLIFFKFKNFIYTNADMLLRKQVIFLLMLGLRLNSTTVIAGIIALSGGIGIIIGFGFGAVWLKVHTDFLFISTAKLGPTKIYWACDGRNTNYT